MILVPKNLVFHLGEEPPNQAALHHHHLNFYANIKPFSHLPSVENPEAVLRKAMDAHYADYYRPGLSGRSRINVPFGFQYLNMTQRDLFDRDRINFFHTIPGMGVVVMNGHAISGTRTELSSVLVIGAFLRCMRNVLSDNSTLFDLLHVSASHCYSVGDYHLHDHAKRFLDEVKRNRWLPWGVQATCDLLEARQSVFSLSKIQFTCGELAVDLQFNARDKTFYVTLYGHTFSLLQNICTFEQIGTSNIRIYEASSFYAGFTYVNELGVILNEQAV